MKSEQFLIHLYKNNFLYHYCTGDETIVVDGNIYLPNISINQGTGNSLAYTLDSNNTIELDLIPNDKDILLQNANIDILLYNENEKKIIFKGFVSQMSSNAAIYSLKVSHIFYKFTRNKGSFFSKTCRATFGDSLCKVDISKYTKNFTIKDVLDKNTIILLDFLDYGKNYDSFFVPSSMQSFVIKSIDSLGVVKFVNNAAFFNIKKDDIIQMTESCNKTEQGCISYGNIVNFQGEPFI